MELQKKYTKVKNVFSLLLLSSTVATLALLNLPAMAIRWLIDKIIFGV